MPTLWSGAALVQAGLSRRHILWSIDQSLKRLDTDFVDLYVAHKEDPHTPLEVLDDNLGAANVRLGVDEITMLDEFTKPRPLYPHWFGEMTVDGPVKEALKR